MSTTSASSHNGEQIDGTVPAMTVCTHRITFHSAKGRTTSVDVDVPDDVDPLDFLARRICEELGIVRFEIQIGYEGGHVRQIGDPGPGTRFTLATVPPGDPCGCGCVPSFRTVETAKTRGDLL